jgi:hypothetical protein
MVMRPKHVAVTEYNIQTSVALDGNPEPDTCIMLKFAYLKDTLPALEKRLHIYCMADTYKS